MIDVSTIKLGNTPLANHPNGTPFAAWSDGDGDGRLDLVMHFSVPQLRSNADLTSATTELTLRGILSYGRMMRATTGITVR